jgi:prepilin-type N-terminal cleavage/methylation domain-containing protein
MRASKGFTLAELLVVLAVVGIAVSVGIPSAAAIRESGRAEAGARVIAAELSAQRWKGVTGHGTRGLQFRRLAGGWAWREVADGNGNGLRTAEITRGIDRAVSPDVRLESLVEHVTIGIPPGGPYPEAPPGTGLLGDTDDPVRFGASDLVSFGPLGTASSGTLYVTDRKNGFCAIVLFGPSSRLRVWRYLPGENRWML